MDPIRQTLISGTGDFSGNQKNFIFFLTFPPRDSLGLLVCYRAHFSVPETVERVYVAIC